MLDIKYIRKNVDTVKKAVKAKKEKADIDKIVNIDRAKREKQTKLEELRSYQKKESKNIAKLKKEGKDATELVKEMSELSEKIKGLQNELSDQEKELHDLLLWVPNITEEDIPEGDESNNIIVRTEGKAKEFDFTPKAHWDLANNLDILRTDIASKLSGSGFSLFFGDGAKLERALLHFMLEKHTAEHGYKEVSPPYIVNRKTMTGSGQLPKLEDDMYFINKDDLFLIPTGEVPFINIFSDEVIPIENLPLKITGATPCFRRESGSYGKDTRGLLRVHQFNKVEMIQFVKEEDSAEALENMLANAESILKSLGLHYRIVILATGDLPFSSTKTYDIEVWAPGVNRWLEVSSCSNCKDFQARRANIKYRDGKKLKYVHILNASGVAIPRLMVALLETYQKVDGHIELPEVLKPYMKKEVI